MEMLQHITRGSTLQGVTHLISFFEAKSSKVTVWAGLCGNNGVIMGPYFFEGNYNGNAYLTMLNEKIIPALIQEFGNQSAYDMFQRLWWVQDGAPAHRLVEMTVRLREIFGNRVVGINHDVQWPVRSPEMTPCDIFYGDT